MFTNTIKNEIAELRKDMLAEMDRRESLRGSSGSATPGGSSRASDGTTVAGPAYKRGRTDRA